MKKSLLTIISILMVTSMLCGMLASCASKNSGSTTQTTNAVGTENNEQTSSESADTEKETSSEKSTSEAESQDDTKREETDSDVENEPLLSGQYAPLIEGANELKNGVQAGFTDSSRDYFELQNSEMKFTYSLNASSQQLVSSLVNKSGNAYFENTMDVFVRMKDGNTYFASGSTVNATANLYRIGMYYYEARFEEQNFFNAPEITDGEALNIEFDSTRSNNMALKDNAFYIKNSNDPYIVFNNVNFSADDYNMLKIRLRYISGTKGAGRVYIMAGGSTAFANDQSCDFTFNYDTANYQDIYVPLYGAKNYFGNVTGIRIDIDGSAGSSYEIESISPAKLGIDKSTPIDLGLCRSFLVYSDKMHHNIQIASTTLTKGIESVGMLTKINADTVQKLIVKDKNGTHDSITNIDWATAEYVGFDIKDAGIFGYILPVHEYAGSIKVTLEEGVYLIEQTRAPEKGVIEPSKEGTENANDFHLSQRIYTDDNHTFDEFIKEAEIERNPIDKYFRVAETEFTSSSLVGYDPIRGIYVIDISGFGTFNPPYYSAQNRYYTSNLTLRSPDDRTVYIMTTYGSGSLECAVLLSKDRVLLPIPVSVCKNFTEAAGERNLYNLDDPDYSESFFPVVLKANDRYELTIANIYQNWGQFPIKQLSSIQFRAPYYHLSTGVTESNCILPWYETKKEGALNTLPDFRAMSAPLWENQPQRNSGGAHTWLEYVDASGNYSATENYADYIDSYGPTYADVTMHNLSYDGKIKATYTHMEMPQTDENRTYYEITYEVLEDISINNFKNDFTFYAVTDNEPAATADYRKIGYLNSDNECVVTKSNLEKGEVKEYILGTNCPYFSMFDMPYDASPDGYTNVAFLVYNSDIVIGGEKCDANFVIVNSYNKIDLTLNLGEVTLKAGDKISINAILMPWGSHESDYTDGDLNVRKVRENTLLNPVKVTSDTDEIVESVYLPKIKSKDGKTATFTIKDGYNNIAVRVYGFKNLTVPTLYELINGEWVKVELSSSTAPDKSGYYHYYDGYMIHYDGDGTYSYSFVTAMDNGVERTFKLDTTEIVESNRNSGKYDSPNYLDMYYDAAELEVLISGSGIYAPKFSKLAVSDDQSYISLYANNVPESFFMVRPTEDEISGQYIVVKYRIPTTNSTRFSNFEFYLSSSSESPVAGENIKYANIKQDGNWHVAIIDASTFNLPTFKPAEDGSYNIKYIRFDVLNTPNLTAENYIDIAFFGMCDSLEEVCAITKDEFDTIDFVSSTGEVPLNTTTCTPEIKVYIDPESGYTESKIKYYSVVDYFHETKVNACGNSVEGITVKSDITFVSPTNVSVAGWAVAEGGIESFAWSADGGLTWNVINKAPANVSDTHINHSQSKLTAAAGSSVKFDDPEASKIGGSFQAPKITIDLSAYAGQTVNLVFAAIPKSDTKSLCLLMCIEDLQIAAQ